MESERAFVPTLGLVRSDGSVKTSNKSDDQESGKESSESGSSESKESNKSASLGAGSSSQKLEENVSSPQMNATAMEFTSSEVEEVIKRPRLTLLILREPSTENSDYVVANGPAEMSDEEVMDEEHIPHKKKKKKKKKSKDKCLTMSRSYAQKLVEIQQSMLKLTSKYQPEPMELEVDRRRRTQSASNSSFNDTSLSLKSPPLSAPILGPGPAFMIANKGKISSSTYRRRYVSTSSNLDNKRRFTRKKRTELEETTQTPTSESGKKNHLSENNVWTPMDDYRLLVNIIQTKGNLEHVFAGTKFSCFYTLEEVAHRWETLLYDEKAGVLAQTAINNLHPVIKTRIQTEALFSEEEENLLKTLKPVPGGTPELGSFMKLLEDNPQVFQNRTARKLLMHWTEMKNFHLLDGQDVRDYKDPFCLFEFQDNAYLTSLPDMAVFQELKTESKLVKHQIRQLEEEIESWHCMQELVVSDGTSDLQSIFSISEFDDQTYAVLRGKQVRYCMRSKEILLGRHSTNNKVDADLTLEGASEKVSRRQAVIQMRGFGDFFIINQGRHSIFVDHIHVPYGGMTKLSDGCVIQITHIKLIFKINDKLMRKEVMHEVKKEVINARLKSYDTFPSNLSSVSMLRTPDGILQAKYASPRKRTTSSASTSNSPVLGLGGGGLTGSFALRPNHIRSLGTSSVGAGPSLLPFSSNGDLTIRPTSQPLTPSPFLTDHMAKQNSKSFNSGVTTGDSDVFKKPAPVSGGRTSSSKTAARTSALPLSPSPSSPGPSAFVSVGTNSLLPGPSIYTVPSISDSINDVVQSSLLLSGITTTSPGANQYIDYTKLGLSADVTVTQRATLPSTTSSTPPTEPSAILSPISASDITTKIDEIPMPSLGLVKIESTN